MRRFKTVEELNMEVSVEMTTEEKTAAFKAWVTEKIDVCETSLNIVICSLEHSIIQRETMRDEFFHNKFEILYGCINSFIEDVEWKCKKDGLSVDILADALNEFKQMKAKVRKVKSEYKQKFAGLKESIKSAMENEEYVATVMKQVQELIINWCKTYVILDCYKVDFAGDRLSKTIEHVTKWILSTKLTPSNEDVAVFVERFMRNHTETVAC